MRHMADRESTTAAASLCGAAHRDPDPSPHPKAWPDGYPSVTDCVITPKAHLNPDEDLFLR